jgi:hypothetical protein
MSVAPEFHLVPPLFMALFFFFMYPSIYTIRVSNVELCTIFQTCPATDWVIAGQAGIQFKINAQLIACYSQVLDQTNQEVKETEDKIKNDELLV